MSVREYSVGGKRNEYWYIGLTFSDVAVNDLLKNLKKKTFLKFVSGLFNLDNETSMLLRRIYDGLYGALEHREVYLLAVLIIAKYQYQIAFVADQEINLLAALTEIMVECEFK